MMHENSSIRQLSHISIQCIQAQKIYLLEFLLFTERKFYERNICNCILINVSFSLIICSPCEAQEFLKFATNVFSCTVLYNYIECPNPLVLNLHDVPQVAFLVCFYTVYYTWKTKRQQDQLLLMYVIVWKRSKTKLVTYKHAIDKLDQFRRLIISQPLDAFGDVKSS